ncbi:MAG: hypothetical protein EAX95_12760 [Candidatus Thorarchaeota archaeon]|nr:hypothetical protein [Candidatus Thorarchaeota archaeon]
MYGIFLINDAGETLASVGWENLKGDSALFGGFVSALQMFIKHISGTEVEEMRFGDLKLLLGRAGENYVVTLHSLEDKDAKELNQDVVDIVRDRVGQEVDDGFLSLISELVQSDGEVSEASRGGIADWTRSEMDRARKKAGDWGDKVF